MQAFTYNDLHLYCGTDFSFSFRLKQEDEILYPFNIIFTAGSDRGGKQLVRKSLLNDPPDIGIDPHGVISVALSPAETAVIKTPMLYYQVDIQLEAAHIERWMVGTINIYKDISHV